MLNYVLIQEVIIIHILWAIDLKNEETGRVWFNYHFMNCILHIIEVRICENQGQSVKLDIIFGNHWLNLKDKWTQFWIICWLLLFVIIIFHLSGVIYRKWVFFAWTKEHCLVIFLKYLLINLLFSLALSMGSWHFFFNHILTLFV